MSESSAFLSIKQPIFVVGPTASGKSDFAIALARHFNGEIISADSMQIYRGMRIGTAAPTASEQQGIPHHLIGLIPPTEPFSVERFRDHALPVLRDILARGKTAIVVGGTGLYFDALLLNHAYAPAEPDQNYRQELHQLALQQGNDAVHRLLVSCDPEAASRIHPNNLKRVIRALEVFYLTAQSITEHDRLSRTGEPEFKPFWFGLLPEPRDFLYARIDRRVDRMMAEGLLTETEFLLQSGVSPDATAMQAIGYKELVPVLLGSMPLAEAVAQIKQRSRRYAKRQLTWFRRNPDIRWLSYENAAAFSTLPDTAVRLLSEPCAAAPVPPSTFC